MGLTKIGALWKGKQGSKAVLNGSVEIGGQKYKVLIFKNDDKDKDTQPDYRICTDMDDVKAAEPYRKSSPPPARKPVDDDALPF